MLRFLINCFLCVIVIVKVSSCCEDHEDLPVKKLSDAEKTWFKPYESNSSFRFRNQYGKTRRYLVDSVATEYYENGGGLYCATAIFERTSYWLHLTGDTLRRSHRFSVSLNENYGSEETTAHVDFDIDRFTMSTSATAFDRDNGDSITTMQINNVVYSKILVQETWRTVVDTLPEIERIYYSKEAGVVRMDWMNGEQWIRQ